MGKKGGVGYGGNKKPPTSGLLQHGKSQPATLRQQSGKGGGEAAASSQVPNLATRLQHCELITCCGSRRGRAPMYLLSALFWAPASVAYAKLLVFLCPTLLTSSAKEESNAVTKPMASESGSRRLFKAGSMLLSSSLATAGSSFSFVKGMMLKLFISERSLCQFRLPKQSRAKVGFGLGKNTILVACTHRSLYKCSFDPVKRGPCRLQQDFYFHRLS